MAEKRKFSRNKGVQLASDLLYAGEKRGVIVEKLTKTCKVAERTVDNWIRDAQPILQARLKQDEIVRAEESAQLTREALQSLHITKERVLAEYAKIAFFDIKKIYKEDGSLKAVSEMDDNTTGAIIAVEGDKIKASDKKAALDSICKVLGYNVTEMDAPPLIQVTGENVSINWNETKSYPKAQE